MACRRLSTSIIACSAFDLWLHTVTKSVIANITSVADTPSLYSFSSNVCTNSKDGDFECAWDTPEWNNEKVNAQGRVVASNSSSSVQAITLAKSGDLAIFVVPNLPSSVSFKAETFGARAQCSSMAPHCKWTTSKGVNDTSPVRNVSCPAFSEIFPDIQGDYFEELPSAGDAKASMWGSACHGPACVPQIHTPDTEHYGTAWLEDGQESKNPIDVWMQLAWGQLIDADYSYQVCSCHIYCLVNAF
jgi:hypothetical protein